MKTSNAKTYTQLLIQAFWLKLDSPLWSSNQALGGEEEQQRPTAVAASSLSQMVFFWGVGGGFWSRRFRETSMASCAGMRAGYLCLSGETPPAIPVKLPARVKLRLTFLILCEAATCWRLSGISLSALDHDSLAFCSPHFYCYANSAEDKSLAVNRVAVKSD